MKNSLNTALTSKHFFIFTYFEIHSNFLLDIFFIFLPMGYLEVYYLVYSIWGFFKYFYVIDLNFNSILQGEHNFLDLMPFVVFVLFLCSFLVLFVVLGSNPGTFMLSKYSTSELLLIS
jgi:hypothetical protein